MVDIALAVSWLQNSNGGSSCLDFRQVTEQHDCQVRARGQASVRSSLGVHTLPKLSLSKSKTRSALLDFSRSGAFRNSQLLTAFLNSSVIGIAIFDKKLRFEAVNDALAGMLGISPDVHSGKSVRKVIGRTAARLEPVLRRVFSEGRHVPSFEITAAVPLKNPPVGWTQAAFPIKNASGTVTKAGVIIIRGTELPSKQTSPPDICKILPTIKDQQSTGISEAKRPPVRSLLFRDLDDSAYSAILAAGRPIARSRGEWFCRQGERSNSLYLLTAGRAKLSGSTPAGKEVLFGWTRTGDVFGLGTLVTSSPDYCWTTSAVEDSSALVWDRATIRGFADCWPSIFENGLRITLQWTLQLQERLEEVATEMVEQRLAHTISHLSPIPGTVAELQISDEELAQMIGTNMFAVNRILNRWRRLGYLQKTRKRLLIRSPENISWIAEHGRDEPMPSTDELSLKTRA